MSELGYKFDTDHFYEILKKRLKENDTIVVPNLDKFTSKDNYSDSVNKSIELQKSPYIIIIDPCDNKYTINMKFDKFNSLAQKERELSDYYSYILYGYDVESMYKELIYTIDTANNPEENNNLLIKEFAQFKTRSIPHNKLNIALKEGDFITVEKFKKNIFKKDIKECSYEDYILGNRINLEEGDVSPLIFPKVVPWFTLDEIASLPVLPEYNCNIKGSYYKTIKEAYDNKDELKLLSLGWNPTVPVNEQSVQDGMNRQLDYATKIKYINFSDVDKYDGNNDIDYGIRFRPLYLIFFKSRFAIAFPDGKGFTTKLREIYLINPTDMDNGSTMYNCSKLYDEVLIKLYGDPNIQLLAIFVDNDVLEKIRYIVSADDYRATNFISPRNITLIYNILSQSRNMLDLDRRKILYAYIINILLDGINGTGSNYTVTDIKKIFMLYHGKFSQYDQNTIDNIMRIICSEDNLKDYFVKNELEPDNDMIKNYRASSIMYSTAD